AESAFAIEFEVAARFGLGLTGAVSPRENLRLARPYAAHAEVHATGLLAGGKSMFTTQLAAQQSQQLITPRLAQITRANLRRVAPSARTANRYNRQPAFLTLGHEQRFVPH